LKYTPVQPPEHINVSDEHPLKSFIILTAGTVGIVITIVLILGLAADYLVKYIPIEYEQDLFSIEGLYLMPFHTDESDAGSQAKQYIQNLIDELHETAGDEYSNHHFKVEIADSLDANAFAVPGGHIVVTKGLLSSVESENGLSMILAHEMAHHYQRHPLRSTGRGIVVSVFLLTFLGIDGSSFLQNILGGTASITNLAFSRQQEEDSDTFAANLLIKFYGHATGAAEFFQHIQSEKNLMPDAPSFLSSHPSTGSRVTTLIELEYKYSGEKKPLPGFIHSYAKTNSDSELLEK